MFHLARHVLSHHKTFSASVSAVIMSLRFAETGVTKLSFLAFHFDFVHSTSCRVLEQTVFSFLHWCLCPSAPVLKINHHTVRRAPDFHMSNKENERCKGLIHCHATFSETYSINAALLSDRRSSCICIHLCLLFCNGERPWLVAWLKLWRSKQSSCSAAWETWVPLVSQLLHVHMVLRKAHRGCSESKCCTGLQGLSSFWKTQIKYSLNFKRVRMQRQM